MRLNRLLFSRRVSVGWEFPGPGATRAAARCALLVLARALLALSWRAPACAPATVR